MTSPAVVKVVAASTPARQMRSSGSWAISSVMARPCRDGRPYSTATFWPPAVTVSRGAGGGSWANAVAAQSRAAATDSNRARMGSLLLREGLCQEAVDDLRVGLATHLLHDLAHEPAE